MGMSTKYTSFDLPTLKAMHRRAMWRRAGLAAILLAIAFLGFYLTGWLIVDFHNWKAVVK